MKNKIKALAYSASVAVLSAPVVAFGATTGTGGFTVPTAGTGNLKDTSVGDLLTQILNWGLSIVGILGVLGFVISGLLYLTAAGDEKKIASAKGYMLYSVIGVVVALIGLIAVKALAGVFAGTSSTAF